MTFWHDQSDQSLSYGRRQRLYEEGFFLPDIQMESECIIFDGESHTCIEIPEKTSMYMV